MTNTFHALLIEIMEYSPVPKIGCVRETAMVDGRQEKTCTNEGLLISKKNTLILQIIKPWYILPFSEHLKQYTDYVRFFLQTLIVSLKGKKLLKKTEKYKSTISKC